MGSFFKYDIPFVPSSDERLKTMIKMAELKPGQTTADLGCGDGKLVIAMAKKGAVAHGFELDPGRAKLARENSDKEGLNGQVVIHRQNFWRADISEFDVIMLYGITSIMEKLEKKLKKEAKRGCKIVSNAFTFPNWEAEHEENNVYLYVKR